jgi:hypothetical protein
MIHDAHQAPKMPAMIARSIKKRAAPVLLTHLEALAPNKPITSIDSPHQNEVIAYTGYQIKVKIPSIANPPTIIKIILPIKAIAKPIPNVEESVEVSDKTIHLPIRSRFSENQNEGLLFFAHLNRGLLRF